MPPKATVATMIRITYFTIDWLLESFTGFETVSKFQQAVPATRQGEGRRSLLIAAEAGRLRLIRRVIGERAKARGIAERKGMDAGGVTNGRGNRRKNTTQRDSCNDQTNDVFHEGSC